MRRAVLWAVTLTGAFCAAARAAGPLPDLGVLGSAAHAEGFAQVLEPRVFEFPRDHGPHPQYRQEWWYVTGNLDAADGERFGFELTFFRFALVPVRQSGGSKWRTRQIYMAHFAVTDVGRKRFRFAQKLSRDALGLAGAGEREEGADNREKADNRENEELNRMRVWIDDWYLCLGLPEATQWTLHAAQDGYELTLDAQALLRPVLNGEQGLSRKSGDPGSASYYYSIPRVTVRGQLVRDGKPEAVQGVAWVDREWGSGTLGRHEQGWDWFALELQDGSSLMFYAMRNLDGGRDPHSAGTWVSPSGDSRELSADEVKIDVEEYWKNSRGERYPARWRVRVPDEGLDLDVRPVLHDQELTTSPRYWEGAVDVVGTRGGRKADGRGYVELVGYARQ